MTQEDKELLLRDLCARLPWGVKVLADLDKTFDGGCIGVLNMIQPYVGKEFPELKGQYLLYQQNSLTPLTVDEIRPYLRPMSSMTEEERNEYLDVKMQECERVALAEVYRPEAISIVLDWLNSHHFDYRGLIEKGLALEAPEGMYKTE